MLQCVAECCSVLQCVAVCCSVLQCVAVRCSALQCVAVCCSAMQYVAVCCSALQCVAVSFVYCVNKGDPLHHATQQHNRHMITLIDATEKPSHFATLLTTVQHCNIRDTLQHTATHSNLLQHTEPYCNILKPTATYRSLLQHTGTYCNTLKPTATH